MEEEIIAQQDGDDDDKPTPERTIIVKKVKRHRCIFIKTVHSKAELNSVGFENGCYAPAIKSLNYEKMTLRCKTVKYRTTKPPQQHGGKCPFALLALRSRRSAAVGDKAEIGMHVYAHGKHNHATMPEKRAKNKLKRTWPDEHPPTSFVTPNGREWTFEKTTTTADYNEKERDIDKIDEFRRKFHCSKGSSMSKRCVNKATLNCTMAPTNNCPFAMFAQKTDRGHYHIYTSGKHTCVHKDKEKSAVLPNVLFSDANPPISFTAPHNNRRWSFLESTEVEETLISILERLKRKFHCHLPYLKPLIHKTPIVRRVTLPCRTARFSKCQFEILVQKTDLGRFHIYESEKHTCLHKEEKCLHHNELMPDAHPPVSIFTLGGQKWTFLETTEAGKSLTEEIDRIRRKYSCLYAAMKNLIKRRSVYRLQLYCITRMRTFATGKCTFKLLAQKTDRDRYHLYASGEHTCIHKNTDKNGIPFKLPLSDAHPLIKFSAPNGRQWKFLKTVEAEKNVLQKLAKFGSDFHCNNRGDKTMRKNEGKKKQPICRLTLYCTTKNSSKCRFALLAHKTDRGRFHLYASGQHTCRYGRSKRGGGRWQKDEEEKMEEEKGLEEDDAEDKSQDEEEDEEEGLEEDEHIPEHDERKEILDEEDEDENYEDENEEDDDEEMELRKESEEEDGLQDDEEEEEDNDEEEMEEGDNDDDQIYRFGNPMRSRSPTVPHEINDVQFVNFIVHPKNEGVKMHRLDVPKKEPGPNMTARITLDEEEVPANRYQKMKVHREKGETVVKFTKFKMPKIENVKEEAPEVEQPGPSNRGQQPTMPPMATINWQNQQPARERWWANATNHRMTAPNNGQRLLRERKGHINYRE